MGNTDSWKTDKKALVIRKGENNTISCTFNGQSVNAEWKADDPGIISVDRDGSVLALSKGNTTIRAYYESEAVISVPVYVDRDALAPISAIPEPRFKLQDGIYTNPSSTLQQNRATLMLVGDIMCLSQQQRHAMANGAFNFNSSFDYVKPVLEKADFVAGNLETMISQTSPYKWEHSRVFAPKGITTNCNAPATFLDAIRYAGFDAVLTSNNHCLDTGIKGLKETLENINRYKLMNTGIFSDSKDTRHLLIDINGIKVALLSYTGTIFNSWESTITQEECDVHVNAYSAEKVKADIGLAKSRGAEYIITYIHWGPINTSVVKPNQVRRAQELADAGVDYIIGSHPHVLMKYDVLKSKDGRNVPIVYSMGNFLSSMDQVDDKLNRDSIILSIGLAKDENGVRLENEEYIPCFTCSTLRGKRYVIMPCSCDINGGYTSANIARSRQRTKKAIGNKINEKGVNKQFSIGFCRQSADLNSEPNARCMFALASQYNICFFYFTPKAIDVKRKTIQGIFWENGEYVEKETAYPDIVDDHFNGEFKSKYLEVYNELSQSCYLIYKYLGSKAKIHKYLAKSGLANYLIETYNYENANIDELIDNYKQIIIKPNNGSKGNNIYRLGKENDLYILQIDDMQHQLTIEDFKSEYSARFTSDYIVQPYIKSVTNAGNPFDIRIDVRRGKDGKWTMLKMYPRIGNKKLITSNLAQGGYIADIKDFLRSEFGDNDKKVYNELVEISKNLPSIIQKNYSREIDSLGIDVGVNRINNELKFFEINSFPGNKYFYFEAAEVKIQYYEYLIKNYYSLAMNLPT